MNPNNEVIFETKDDHLVSNLYRGSITAVPSLETELYVWGCAHQTSNWIVLNWRTREWRVVESISDAEAPSARHAHTATYFSMRGESYIAVLGGSASSANDSNPPFADVYIYNIKQKLWLPVPLVAESQAGAEQPTPRLFHSATFVEVENEPYLAVVGGIFSDRTLAVNVPVPTMINRRALVLPELRFYNLRLRTWSQPVYVPGRYRHNAVLIPSSSREPKLMIVGGRDMKGNLSKEPLIIDIRSAYQSLRHSFPSSHGSPAEDYGQGIYWSLLGGIVQPLGPFYGNCHAVSHGDSVIVFALLDRAISQTHTQPTHTGHRSSRSRTESRPRPSEQTSAPYRHDSNPSHSGWALSFSGGSVSFRELRKVRRTAQKAEVAAQSIAALSAQVQAQMSPEALEPPVAPALHPQPPTPAPAPVISVPPRTSWLWCGVVNSGWGTMTGGEEDLLLLVYQAEERIFLVPLLLSALGLSRSKHEDEPSTLRASLSDLLPPLWDGTPQNMSSSHTNPSIPPFADFLLHTSTPGAPPLAVHRNILLSCSSYFKSLLTSGFTESMSGEANVDEGYAASYALCCWIYTRTLPAWLETSSTFWSNEMFSNPPIEFSYAAHAGETLCELLIAANARMLPALATHVRALIRSDHMYAPELAPLVWRAAELTDVTDPEDLFSCAPPGVASVRWVADIVQSQVRPPEDRKVFMAAVSKWCCEGEPEVVSAMEGAREWLEPEIWDAWVQQREKLGGGGCKPVELRKTEGDAVMKNI
ncbi:hypothetical protein FRC12_022666 [Ceratobasidium sp. 428]|nr:hypothetical protein FRC12_022666 [Ceratobasidium sp. 428]